MSEKLLMSKSDELMLDFFRDLPARLRPAIGLMGGWAVYYALDARGISHMGSRDIDIFFDPKKISLKAVCQQLKKMGFRPHSTFRWVKIFNSDTEEEIEAEKAHALPLYMLTYIFVDIAAPVKMAHVLPEPLLKRVFKGERSIVTIDNVKLLIPSIELQVDMKLKSVLRRTDEFKRTKDVADLFGLLNNAPELWKITDGRRVHSIHLSPKLLRPFKAKLGQYRIDGTLATAAQMANSDVQTLAELFGKL